MHTGIVLAVEADDARSAVALAQHFNENNANWSDWNEHGGRWDDVTPDSVLRYSDDPSRFIEIINTFKQYTFDAKYRYLEELGDVTIKELVTDKKYLPFSERVGDKPAEMTEEERERYLDESLAVFRAKKLLQIHDGEFCPDSHFYDINEYTVSDKYLLKRIEETPKEQFLVVWDYHY